MIIVVILHVLHVNILKIIIIKLDLNKTKFDRKFKIVRLNDKVERWIHAIGEIKFDKKDKPMLSIGNKRHQLISNRICAGYINKIEYLNVNMI